MDDREIDDSLDAGLAGHVERDERLGELIGHHSVEQKEGGHALEGAAQDVHIEQVALDDVHPIGQVGSGRIADEGAHFGATPGELLDDLTADIAGGASYENGHGIAPGWFGGPMVGDSLMVR